MRMRNCCGRMALIAAIGPGAAALHVAAGRAGALPPIRIAPLVLEGDEVPGVGFITIVSDVVVNNRGEWVVVADTNNTDSNTDEVLLRNGVLIQRERFPIEASGPGRVLFFFNAPTINNNGDSVFHFTNIDTSVTPTDVESGMYFNLTPVAYEDDDAMFPVAPGAPFTTFADGKINDLNQVFSRFTFISASFPTLATFQLAPDGSIVSRQMVHMVNDFAPGQGGRLFTGFQVTETQNAFNNVGDYIFQGILDGDTNTNNLYYKNGDVIAQQGTPSPVAGRDWAEMNSTFTAVDLNNTGDWVLRGTLAGDAASDAVIIRNGVKFVQEGDAVAAFGGALVSSFGAGSAPVRIDDSGRIVWYVDTNLADTNTDTAIMRDGEIVLRERTTPIPTGGAAPDLMQSFGSGPGWLNVSDNGQHIIFIGNLVATVPPRPNTAGTVNGAFLITICPADINGSGAVTVQDVFDFLALFFDNDAVADFNRSGGVSVQDVFDFVGAFFAGC